MSVIGLIMSFPLYLRSAMVWFPLSANYSYLELFGASWANLELFGFMRAIWIYVSYLELFRAN